MTALPKAVPYLYAICAAEDARTEFAEEASRAARTVCQAPPSGTEHRIEGA